MESAINFGTKKGTLLIWLQPKHIEHELEKLNESPALEWTLALVTESSLAWNSRFYDEAPMNIKTLKDVCRYNEGMPCIGPKPCIKCMVSFLKLETLQKVSCIEADIVSSAK